jgi:hypothetical protein
MIHLHLAVTLTAPSTMLIVARVVERGQWYTLHRYAGETACEGENAAWHALLAALRLAAKVLPDPDGTQKLTLYSDLPILDRLMQPESFEPALMAADTQLRLLGFHTSLRLLLTGWSGGRYTLVKREEGFLT